MSDPKGEKSIQTARHKELRADVQVGGYPQFLPLRHLQQSPLYETELNDSERRLWQMEIDYQHKLTEVSYEISEGAITRSAAGLAPWLALFTSLYDDEMVRFGAVALNGEAARALAWWYSAVRGAQIGGSDLNREARDERPSRKVQDFLTLMQEKHPYSWWTDSDTTLISKISLQVDPDNWEDVAYDFYDAWQNNRSKFEIYVDLCFAHARSFLSVAGLGNLMHSGIPNAPNRYTISGQKIEANLAAMTARDTHGKMVHDMTGPLLAGGESREQFMLIKDLALSRARNRERIGEFLFDPSTRQEGAKIYLEGQRNAKISVVRQQVEAAQWGGSDVIGYAVNTVYGTTVAAGIHRAMRGPRNFVSAQANELSRRVFKGNAKIISGVARWGMRSLFIAKGSQLGSESFHAVLRYTEEVGKWLVGDRLSQNRMFAIVDSAAAHTKTVKDKLKQDVSTFTGNVDPQQPNTVYLSTILRDLPPFVYETVLDNLYAMVAAGIVGAAVVAPRLARRPRAGGNGGWGGGNGLDPTVIGRAVAVAYAALQLEPVEAPEVPDVLDAGKRKREDTIENQEQFDAQETPATEEEVVRETPALSTNTPQPETAPIDSEPASWASTISDVVTTAFLSS